MAGGKAAVFLLYLGRIAPSKGNRERPLISTNGTLLMKLGECDAAVDR